METKTAPELFAASGCYVLPLDLKPRADEVNGAGGGAGGVFRCIVADPPWDIDMTGGSNARSETKPGRWSDPKQDNSRIRALPYPTMSVDEIAALKVPAAEDAHCYIWTINKYVEATYGIARAWGFEPSCLLTWVKAPMGLGLGGTFASNIEFILFCRRGKLSAKLKLDTRWWGWPRGCSGAGRHSQKPEGFQTVVEKVSPGPYLEMFARRQRPGWTSWGNEVSSGLAGGGGRGEENDAATEPKGHNARISDGEGAAS